MASLKLLTSLLLRAPLLLLESLMLLASLSLLPGQACCCRHLPFANVCYLCVVFVTAVGPAVARLLMLLASLESCCCFLPCCWLLCFSCWYFYWWPFLLAFQAPAKCLNYILCKLFEKNLDGNNISVRTLFYRCIEDIGKSTIFGYVSTVSTHPTYTAYQRALLGETMSLHILSEPRHCNISLSHMVLKFKKSS